MELFEALTKSLKPPRVVINNKVTYCRGCDKYFDLEGNEIPQRYALENCIITYRFCDRDCYLEYNNLK